MIPLPLTLKGDISRFNAGMTIYARDLGVAPSDVVRRQAGLLIAELAEKSAPKNRQSLERKIEKDINRVYAPVPVRMLPVAHRQGHGFMWLMATPRVVTGVKSYDYHIEDSVSDLQRLFHKTNPRGNRWITLGNRKQGLGSQIMRVVRGKSIQKVMQLNRIVVRRRVLQEFARSLKERAGTLGGSWAIAWDVLRSKGRKPAAFKYRHVEDGTARGTYIDGLGIPGRATFTIINQATGVESGKQLAMLHESMDYRARMMDADLRNQLRGAYRKAFKR